MSTAQSKLYTRAHMLTIISVMRDLIDGTAQIYNGYNAEPSLDSLAMQERKRFSNSELIKDVHYRGVLSMESAADHMMVFVDSISEPAKTIAPWTCVRGLLESSALAVWFLDPRIDAKERVGRCFAFRYSGFVEQIKFFQVEKLDTEIHKAQQRMKKVEQDAISLGYPQLLNKNGEINGIAQHMPSIIELIKLTLNREGDYRLLSGVAHGHHWATSQVGFRFSEENLQGQVVKTLEKHLHPESVLFATNIAVSSFSKVLWNLWRLYGWDIKEIESFLEKIYDRLYYKTEARFWRSNSSTNI